MNSEQLECPCLISACAADPSDKVLWHEFLRRYSSIIKKFISRVCFSRSPYAGILTLASAQTLQPSDLFQSVLLRLLENGCAAMKRFSGSTEEEWLAYVAVITRSVVCTLLRFHFKAKRRNRAPTPPFLYSESALRAHPPTHGNHFEIEQIILLGELSKICERTIRNHSGAHAARDMLIFQLYFFHGLSVNQIAVCRGVNMSRAGVEKVIGRLVCRIRHAANEMSFREAAAQPA